MRNPMENTSPLSFTEKIAVRDCMDLLARTIYMSDSTLDKSLYEQFETLLNTRFDLILNNVPSDDNVFQIDDFEDLKRFIIDSEGFEKLRQEESGFKTLRYLLDRFMSEDLESNGPEIARAHLAELFHKDTLSLFPKKLNQESLRQTIMKLRPETTRFKEV